MGKRIKMRWTIGRKAALGISSFLGLFLLVALTALYQSRDVEARIREITEVEEPISAAAYEMEINAIGTGMGVLKYLDTGDPRYRQRVEKDNGDFVRFKTMYDRLVKTQRGREMGNRVWILFQQYKALGDSLMDCRDDQADLLALVSELYEDVDEIIDERIQAHIDREGPDGYAKELEGSAMEADAAEVGTWPG